MSMIFVSVLIFGLVHPLSKLILDQGVPLSYFCALYIGIRFLFQAPFLFLQNKSSTRQSKTVYLPLLFIGLVGALLQIFEFKGIHQGLAPATVTFLMFSYPLWILIFNLLTKSQSIGLAELLQSGAVLTGVFLISRDGSSHLDWTSIHRISTQLIYPLLAGVLIALWITLSNRLRKRGVGTLQLSAYYDLFSLVALLGIFGGQMIEDWSRFLAWTQTTNHIYGIVLYSTLVGLLPNFLFYHGSRTASSHFAGSAMALEPLFSAIYSALIWQSTISPLFWIGGIFILLANMPRELWLNPFQKKELTYEH